MPGLTARVAWVLVAIVTLLCIARSALATPAADLNDARTQFRGGNYAEAISLLSSLLYPKAQLTGKAQLAEAHLLLGVAYLETGNVKGADTEFEEALFLDPTLKLDPLVFSARAVDVFDHKRRQLEDRLAVEEKLRQEAALRERLQFIVANSRVIEQRSYYINFLPFGLGQFQNKDYGKGTALLVSQAVLGGTSFALWGLQVFRYGFPGDVPLDDVSLVNTMQVAQITTGIGFYALYAYGVIDSLIHYEPVIIRPHDPEYLKELEKEFELQQKKKAKTTSLRLMPAVGPDHAGLGLSLEF